jgi:hypothetical protein
MASQIILAVAGNTISGVTVAQIRQSISLGIQVFFAQDFLYSGDGHIAAAFTGLFQNPSFFNTGTGADPLIIGIHHLFQVKLVSFVSGTYPPTAVIAAVILFI